MGLSSSCCVMCIGLSSGYVFVCLLVEYLFVFLLCSGLSSVCVLVSLLVVWRFVLWLCIGLSSGCVVVFSSGCVLVYFRVEHPSFQKNPTFLRSFPFFPVLYKRTELFLRFFPFFIKEWNNLCVLSCS